MRIAFFADLHLDPATEINTRPALRELVAQIPGTNPDLIVNLGDLSWKRGHLAPWVSLELREAHVRLAGTAPVIVVAGNHDLAGGGEVGTVMGSLELAADSAHALELYETPRVQHGTWYNSGLYIACLPYPSRHWLLANRPEIKASEINAEMSKALTECVEGLAAQVPAGKKAILLFHGSIAGARSDSEQSMSTEIDTVLNEADIPACFQYVLCGHIHRRQQIGRAIYPGSPAPLSFAEEQHPHGFGVLDTETGVVEWHELPVAHRLVTIRNADRTITDEVLTGGVDITCARVRVQAELAAGENAGELRDYWIRRFTALGAEDVRVVIERDPERNREVAAPEIQRADMIDLYLKRRTDAADLVDELKALAVQVDQEIPAEVRLRELSGSYRLIRVAFDNWKSYGEGNVIELEQLAGTVSIEGENAVGKSNAAEVECFALYGRTPRGRIPLGELVRQGQKDARVVAEIEAQGQRWKIERRLKVNGKGVGSADLTLYAGCRNLDTDVVEWTPVSLGTAAETQAAITQLVGPIDLYLSTRFASQGDIDRLVDLSGAEMKDTLQAVLATSVFEAREDRARAHLSAAERQLDTHTAGLAAWQAEAGMLETREAAARDGAAGLATAEEDLATVTSSLGVAREIHGVKVAALQQSKQSIVEWDRSAAAVDAARKKLNTLTEAGYLDNQLIATSGDLDAAAIEAEVSSLEASITAMKERRAREDGARQAASEAEHALASARSAVDSHLQLRKSRLELMGEACELRKAEAMAYAEGAFEAMDAVQAGERSKLETLNERLARAQAGADRIAEAPFGEKCTPCPLMGGAVADRDSLPALQDAIDTQTRESLKSIEIFRAKQAGEQLKLDTLYQDAVNECSAYAAAPDSKLVELQSTVRSAESRLEQARQRILEPFDELGLRRAMQQLAEAQGRQRQVRKVEDARQRLAAAAPAIAMAEGELEHAESEHNTRGARPDLRAIVDAVLRSEEQVEKLKATHDAATQRRDAMMLASGHYAAELKLCRRAVESLAAAEPETAKLERQVRVARVYLEAVGRDGIPYMMLEQALPALEAHANHFLCADQASGLSLEVEGLRELQSGERRLDVVIRYSNAFGTHSLAAASGFERVAIGYALRAALAQVQAETQGVRIEHWIADEGWGVFDESNLVSVGQPMVRRLAETFGRVILISHQAPIREVCESRFEVEGEAMNGSSLRLVA